MNTSFVAALRATLDRNTPRPGFSRQAADALVTKASISNWEAGEYISTADDGRELIGFVVDGIVKIVCRGTQGARMVIQFVPPGRFFRLGWPFEPFRRRRIQAMAHVSSVVASVRPDAMVDVVAHLPPMQVLQLMAYSWRGLSRHLLERSRLITMPLRDRVLHGLRMLARDFGRVREGGLLVDLPLTHADLAEFVAGSRAHVSRCLLELQRARRIAVAGGRFVVCADDVVTMAPLSAPS